MFLTRLRRLRTGFRRAPDPVPFEKVVNQQGSGASSARIPARVFQTTASALVHPRHRESIDKFRAVNQDLDFTVFDEHATDSYMKAQWGHHPVFSIYSSAKFGPMKADVFRYCIVFDQGGYYVDFDKGASCSLRSLHSESSTALVTAENNAALFFPEHEAAERLDYPHNLYAQWVFGFEAQHEVLRIAIDRIIDIAPYFENRVFSIPKTAILTLTGPGLFTYALRQYLATTANNGVVQAGIDLHGHGIFRLPGSKLTRPPEVRYAKREEEKILGALH